MSKGRLLTPEQLEILSHADPVDITYADFSQFNEKHPHKGATDPSGELGYVHDATALRKNPPEFDFEGKKREVVWYARWELQDVDG